MKKFYVIFQKRKRRKIKSLKIKTRLNSDMTIYLSCTKKDHIFERKYIKEYIN